MYIQNSLFASVSEVTCNCEANACSVRASLTFDIILHIEFYTSVRLLSIQKLKSYLSWCSSPMKSNSGKFQYIFTDHDPKPQTIISSHLYIFDFGHAKALVFVNWFVCDSSYVEDFTKILTEFAGQLGPPPCFKIVPLNNVKLKEICQKILEIQILFLIKCLDIGIWEYFWFSFLCSKWMRFEILRWLAFWNKTAINNKWLLCNRVHS